MRSIRSDIATASVGGRSTLKVRDFSEIFLYDGSIVARLDFLHHPTFPREATRGDFFAVCRMDCQKMGKAAGTIEKCLPAKGLLGF